MVCPKCNTIINDNVAYCPVCGNKTETNVGYNDQNMNYTAPPSNGNNGRGYRLSTDASPKKRKIPKWVPVLIVGIYVILIAAVAITILVIKGNSDKKKTYNGSLPSSIDLTTRGDNPGIVIRPDEPVPVEPSDEPAQEAKPEEEPKPEELPKPTPEESKPVPEDPEPIPEDPKAEQSVPDKRRLVIATGGLNLRTYPDSGSKSKGLIPDGSIIVIETESDGWAYTYYDGMYGWCSAEFLFIPKEYDYIPLYSARVTAASGVQLVVQDHMVGTRNALTTIPYDHVVYVYIVDGYRAFVSYNNIYGWCDTYDLRRRY